MLRVKKTYISILFLLITALSPMLQLKSQAAAIDTSLFSDVAYEGLNGKIVQGIDDLNRYFILDGKKCLIPNMETYNNLFRSNAQIKLPLSFVNSIPSGEALTNGAILIEASGGSEVYLLTWGKKHWIKSYDTFTYCNFDSSKIQCLPKIVIDSIPSGNDIVLPSDNLILR